MNAKEQIEVLEETIRQQREQLAPVISLKPLGLGPQETKFVMCLYASPTRIRTEAQLLSAVFGVDDEHARGATHIRTIKHNVLKKLGDKIQIKVVRGVGYQIEQDSVDWLRTVVEDLTLNRNNIYDLKNAMAAHVGRKRPLSAFNMTYPGALPYKLRPRQILMIELMLRSPEPVSLRQLEAHAGLPEKKGNTEMFHLCDRGVPPAYILRHGSTQQRTYSINPTYREELIGGFKTWMSKFETLYETHEVAT